MDNILLSHDPAISLFGHRSQCLRAENIINKPNSSHAVLFSQSTYAGLDSGFDSEKV